MNDEQDKLNRIEVLAQGRRLGELARELEEVLRLIREDLIPRMEDFERRLEKREGEKTQ